MGSLGFLSQSIGPVPGSTYDLTFFLALVSHQPPPMDHFEVSFNGITLVSFNNPGSFSYQEFSFTNLLATGSSSSLQFGFRSDHGFFELDDVSVVQHTDASVPDTFSTLWLAFPVIGILGFMHFHRQVRSPLGGRRL